MKVLIADDDRVCRHVLERTLTGWGHEVRVCADGRDALPEANEANNCRQETWACDPRPLAIVGRPEATNVTSTTARVRWAANKPCTCQLSYGRSPAAGQGQVPSQAVGNQHTAQLAELVPDAVYHLAIACQDGAGDTAEATTMLATRPEPDSIKPFVQIGQPSSQSGIIPLTAAGGDNVGISRIGEALAHDPNLRISNQAVYAWRQGHAPRPARAMPLVELSGGRLMLAAICQPGRPLGRMALTHRYFRGNHRGFRRPRFSRGG